MRVVRKCLEHAKIIGPIGGGDDDPFLVTRDQLGVHHDGRSDTTRNVPRTSRAQADPIDQFPGQAPAPRPWQRIGISAGAGPERNAPRNGSAPGPSSHSGCSYPKNWLLGAGRSRFSRKVRPVYSVRKRLRRCNSGTTRSTKSSSPLGDTGVPISRPSQAPDMYQSAIWSATWAALPFMAGPLVSGIIVW